MWYSVEDEGTFLSVHEDQCNSRYDGRCIRKLMLLHERIKSMRRSSREKLKRPGTVPKCLLLRRSLGYLKRGQVSSEVRRKAAER